MQGLIPLGLLNHLSLDVQGNIEELLTLQDVDRIFFNSYWIKTNNDKFINKLAHRSYAFTEFEFTILDSKIDSYRLVYLPLMNGFADWFIAHQSDAGNFNTYKAKLDDFPLITPFLNSTEIATWLLIHCKLEDFKTSAILSVISSDKVVFDKEIVQKSIDLAKLIFITSLKPEIMEKKGAYLEKHITINNISINGNDNMAIQNTQDSDISILR